MKRENLKHGVPISLAPKVAVDTTPLDYGGASWLDKKEKTVHLQAPAPTGAYARTIALHELLHMTSGLTKPPRHKGIDPQAIQFAMDMILHRYFWPRSATTGQNRDALVTAIQDYRHTRAGLVNPKLLHPSQWNTRIGQLCRACAIAEQVGGPLELQARACRLLFPFYPKNAESTITDDFREMLSMASKGKHKLRKLAAKIQEYFRYPSPEPEDHTPAKPEGDKQGWQGFRIVELEKTRPTMPRLQSRTISYRASGCRLVFGRLARAALSGDARQLFRHVRRHAGGTILIDASGSMGVTAERLAELCSLCPSATVAYYNGQEKGKLWQAALVVWGRDGKQSSLTAAPYHWGGNECDLEALTWLLRQPGPRILISDLKFCGGLPGHAMQALALLEESAKAGQVQVIYSIDEAFQRFAADR